MPDTTGLRNAYLRRLLEDMQPTALESSPSFTESVRGGEETEALSSALESVRRGGEIAGGQRDMLEAIVVPLLRPVFNVVSDSFANLDGDLWKPVNANRAHIERAIRSIGRIELSGVPGAAYGGTGFIVGPGLILTNHHVAEKFSPASGFRNLTFLPGRSSAIDFKREAESNESVTVEVKRVRMVHPHWDAAILEVDGLGPDRAPLTLAGEQPEGIGKRLVCVIGYPAFDTRGDTALQLKMFGKLFERKRLQPGFTMSYQQVLSYGHIVEALAHDCSTLGGNSGSAVIDAATGEVLGLHFGGIEFQANYAVPGWELARDRHVVDLGVRFSRLPAVGSAPADWMGAWTGVESAEPAVAATSRTDEPRRGGGLAREAVQLSDAWFERASTDDLVEALRADPIGVKSRLKDLLGDAEGERLANELTPPTTEGLLDVFDPPPDPDLPEIVWLHGIAGGHLARPGFLRNRKWFDLKEFASPSLATTLSLAPDGISAADSGRGLEADGMLDGVVANFYGDAQRTWRRAQFVVHPYSFDWRKGIESLATELHGFLEAKRRERPRKFMLVAHSMGGLLCCAYAQRHPEWRDAVQRVVLMGSPIGGSYAPMEACTGTYGFVRTLARFSRNSIDDLRGMCATLPGLMDMLPAPSLFPDAAEAYSSNRYPGGVSPRQKWLDQSRNLKPALLNSPLLERTTLLVSVAHPTVASLVMENGFVQAGPATGAGDGTVPARAAVIAGVPAFKVTFEHSLIGKDPAAIAAVVSLAKTGRTDLPPVQPEDLTAVLPPREAPVLMEEAIEAFDQRMVRREIRASDVEWLFRGNPDTLPE